MDSEDLNKLESINNISEFINFIKPYYPDLKIDNFLIEEIEKELLNIYIKLIGRIISFSPDNMRYFLKDYLLKYEIMNIRQIILGTIIGMSIEEKRRNVNFLVQEYLDNTEFIENLIKIHNLEEIQLYLKNTKYNEPIREGLTNFRNTNEIFVLESFLEQLYYKNFKKERKTLNKVENSMITLYSKYITEIYNIKIIYRGILNDIDRYLLSQFLVKSSLFLDYDKTNSLLHQEKIVNFFDLLNQFLKKPMEFKSIFTSLKPNLEHPMWEIEESYKKYFFKKFKLKFDKIDYSTIYRIFELLIKKEREIKYSIIPNVIRILHEKYKIFK